MEYQLDEADAKIFLPKEEIDTETLKQIRKIVTHPGIEHARIMPDCHHGNGCCVGFTSVLQDKIVPNYVGGDIGCGIITYLVGNLTYGKKEKKLAQIEKRIRMVVPMGIEDGCVFTQPIVTKHDLQLLCAMAQEEAVHFSLAYRKKYGISIGESMPEYSEEWLVKYCQRIGANYQYVLNSLGTLGGGNHFIEINEDSRQRSYITIHSGSRHFGRKVCQYHQNKINKFCKFDIDVFDREMKKRGKIRDRVERKKIEDEVRKEIMNNLHAKYLEGEEAYLYYFDMIFAQKYAQLNRRLMLRSILNVLGLNDHLCEDQCTCVGYLGFDHDNVIESIHNYIDFKDFILRKGSIAAYSDKRCIIALNMRDGILICRGKGNPDWNYSSAHGSGRAVNRQRASHRLRMKEFVEEMKDVYSTSVVFETLDESPMAYKDTELIKTALGSSVEIIEQLRPVINLKARS